MKNQKVFVAMFHSNEKENETRVFEYLEDAWEFLLDKFEEDHGYSVNSETFKQKEKHGDYYYISEYEIYDYSNYDEYSVAESVIS